MIKYTPAFLKKLEDILTESAYTVRYERGNFQSGWCLLERKSVVVLNKFLDTEGRINTLADIIPQLAVNFDKLTHESQILYEFLLQEAGAANTGNTAETQLNLNNMSNLSVTKKDWGTINDQQVSIYELNNGTVKVFVSNYGGTIQSIEAPDKNGRIHNIVAGYHTAEEYRDDNDYYLGALVGRYANRIADGKFTIAGESYTLPVNNGPNSLHGGVDGFHRKIWEVTGQQETATEASVTMEYTSKDGEEGYPGNLQVQVTYALSADNKLKIQYRATTDKATPVSLTNHSYFNLNGFEDVVTGHELKINAESYTKKNENNVPAGELEFLDKDHPLYFGEFTKLEKNIDQFAEDRGFDHNYVLTMQPFQQLLEAAELRDPQSGRYLKVYTDQPGLQIYTANWFDGSRKGTHSKPYGKYDAIALETQAFPNSPNVPAFPNSILQPGERYSSTTVYEIGVE